MNMSGRSSFKKAGFLVGLVAFCFLVRWIITGGYPTVKLPSTSSTLAGPVSIGIGQAGSGALQEAGKDYKIESAKYFDNNEWVVVNILPLKNNADPAVMVLKKVNGFYQTVLGPAGQFSGSYFYVLPLDVYQYMVKQRVFNG